MIKHHGLCWPNIIFNYTLFNFINRHNFVHFQITGFPSIPNYNDILPLKFSNTQTMSKYKRTFVDGLPNPFTLLINFKHASMKRFDGNQFVDAIVVEVEKEEFADFLIKHLVDLPATIFIWLNGSTA